MRTKRELVARWTTQDGQHRASEIMKVLRARAVALWGKDKREINLDDEVPRVISSLLFDFPYTDDVSPAIDLRAIDFAEGLSLYNMRLVDVRLDFAVLGGHFVGCDARRANFNGAKAAGVLFQYNDLSEATFIGASLKDCYFGQSKLDNADFSKAKLQTAQFTDASCRCAIFLGADMRLAHCPRADFSGADLSGVDMTEATMGGVKFDERTKLAGTILRGASMNDDFSAFAEKAGAILGPDQNLLLLASLDATKTFLDGENADGLLDGVLRHLVSLRKRLSKDGSFVWEDELLRQTPPNLVSTVEFAISQGSKNVASQLD